MRDRGGAASTNDAMEDLTIGQRIKLVRTIKLRVEQGALGRLVGVSGMAVSKWERDANEVSEEHLRKLALATGVPYEWFVTGQTMDEEQRMVVRLLQIVSANEQEFLETIKILLTRHFENAYHRKGK